MTQFPPATARIPVLAAPHLDPGVGRIEVDLPEGMTLAEIVRSALPGATSADLDRVRVALVTDKGSQIVLPEYWRCVRPRAGVRVVIRVIAAKDALRSILQIVVAITSLVLAPIVGGALAGAFGLSASVWTGIASLGITLVGNLLINALVPPPKDERAQNRYTIQGWKNRLDPNGAVPQVLGTVRYAPPFAARSWTEIVGDAQYVRALFTFGYGPLALTDFRLGETSLSHFDDVEIEVRDGQADDDPVTIYPTQIVEESIGADLVRPLVKDALGVEVTPRQSELKPIVRTTGPDASGVSIILGFPSGLVSIDRKGRRVAYAVTVRIEQRLVTSDAWTLVQDLTVRARKLELFFRQVTWTFPTRGRWQVRLTMLTEDRSESDASNVSQRVSWAAMQTLRPEYPLNFAKPLALVAPRIRATHQINGSIDNFSAVASTLCLDWDHVAGEWTERATSNPASLFRHVLQSPANVHPVPDGEIDLDALVDWHDFCRVNGLRYDAAHDQAGSTLRDVLAEVAAAGRALPRHDGLRWSVTVDRPSEMLVVDHVNPRNSREFRAARRYFTHPHAVRVSFLDASNDYHPAERLVRWPGYGGPVDLVEVLPLPGKVHADEVWREATRRMLETVHRPDSYQCIQDGAVRVATRGDLVALSHEVMSSIEAAARVREVRGNVLVLDDAIVPDDGGPFAIRFRSGADATGASVVRAVSRVTGAPDAVMVPGRGPMPAPGALVHFGPSEQVDRRVIIRGVEAGEDAAAILHLIDAAPEIDATLDGLEAPPWSGRVGAEIDIAMLVPPVPRFTRVATAEVGAAGLGSRIVEFAIVPGTGPVATTQFEVQHRLASSGTWTTLTVPAATGGGEIAGYATGAAIVTRARALAMGGAASAWSAQISLTVGSEDAAIPSALDAASVSVSPLLGGVLVLFGTGSDPALAQVQIYRSTSATLNREADAAGAPILVATLSSYSAALGDTSRTNLLASPGFDTVGLWTGHVSWSIAGGLATHATSASGAIGQPITTEAGRWYRLGFDVSGRSAGTLTPRLTGGSTRTGAAVSTNAQHLDRIQAVTGNNRVEWLASTPFDGSLDNVVAYLETAACLSQGTHYVWLEPQNEDGVPGPVSGPLAVTVI